MDKSVENDFLMLTALQTLLLIDVAKALNIDTKWAELGARAAGRIIDEATKAAAPQGDKPNGKATGYDPKLQHGPGVSYDRDVISTSVPSLDELNKPDFEKGQDPLG